VLTLNASCKISEIRPDTIKKRKQQFVFRISWAGDDEEDTKEEQGAANEQSDKKTGILRSRSRNKDLKEDKKGAPPKLSATKEEKPEKEKSGYMSSLMSWAGFNSAEAISFNNPVGEKDKVILFATDKYEDAEIWVRAIEDQLRSLCAAPGASVNSPIPCNAVVKKIPPPPEIRVAEVDSWLKSSAWTVFSVVDGVRVFEYVGGDTKTLKAPPCLRVNVCMTGSVTDVFMTVMSLPPSCRNGTIKSLKIIETIDNCTDVIHIVLEPIYLAPTWTGRNQLYLRLLLFNVTR
jgi:hypothetical protein